jgi:hypothetical protein
MKTKRLKKTKKTLPKEQRRKREKTKRPKRKMRKLKTPKMVRKMLKRSNFKRNTASLPKILKEQRNNSPSTLALKTWTIRATRS